MTELVDVKEPAAHDAIAEVHAMQRKQWRIGRRVKIGNDPLIGIRSSRCVGAEGQKKIAESGGRAEQRSRFLEATIRRTSRTSGGREIG